MGTKGARATGSAVMGGAGGGALRTVIQAAGGTISDATRVTVSGNSARVFGPGGRSLTVGPGMAPMLRNAGGPVVLSSPGYRSNIRISQANANDIGNRLIGGAPTRMTTPPPRSQGRRGTAPQGAGGRRVSGRSTGSRRGGGSQGNQ